MDLDPAYGPRRSPPACLMARSGGSFDVRAEGYDCASPMGGGARRWYRRAPAEESEGYLDHLVESVPAGRMDYAQILSGLLVGSHPRAVGDVERLRRESAIT